MIAKGTKEAGGTNIDMLQVYIRTAMDIIGRAGFNYYFEKHQDDEGHNPLSRAFNAMINGMLENKTLALIQSVLPQVLDLVSRRPPRPLRKRGAQRIPLLMWHPRPSQPSQLLGHGR